jgi:hypothetical protein
VGGRCHFRGVGRAKIRGFLLHPGTRGSSFCLLFHRMLNRSSALIEYGAVQYVHQHPSRASQPWEGAKIGGLHASDRRSLNLPNTRPASMAAAQDAEHGQMLLNPCVRLPRWYLILTHWTSPEPSTSPNSGTSQGREYVDPFLSCSDARLRTALVQHSNRGIAGKAIPDTC